MPIPKSRAEVVELVAVSFDKLQTELDTGGPRLAALKCVDDWTVKDLLAVRLWWTVRVVDWIEIGRRGGRLHLPAKGYTWRETPRLNEDIVRAARGTSYESIRQRLARSVERVLGAIDILDDVELLEAGVYAWAGKWPLARWISMNTSRQYATARSFIRRAGRS
ncbi:MAG: ClbS/DfsB family four-helix bundle protein [Candidatus Eisenbacteria bacterium]|nr:ClbS/DfsB family four-helix bundle protein [Candidatus Eisenbacteria bacterium]